jgi:hypothetical protein
LLGDGAVEVDVPDDELSPLEEDDEESPEPEPEPEEDDEEPPSPDFDAEELPSLASFISRARLRVP